MENSIVKLRKIADQISEDIITTGRDCNEAVHIGGNLTLSEIMAVLFFSVINVDPKNPKWKDRDRVILSKGHGNIALSSAMARKGFFSIDELKNFDALNAMLSMHIDKHRMPGVEISSGSLGHGLSVAVGAALGGKIDKAGWRVYCIISDGELMEGSTWEALMSAANFHLGNLTVILDRNRLTIEGDTEENIGLEPLAMKIKTFNWSVMTVNGHDIGQLLYAFNQTTSDKNPKFIIANTIKGHGIPSVEGKASSHFFKISNEDANNAIARIKSTHV